jgi:hypothetical protein
MRPKLNEEKINNFLYDSRLKMALEQSKRIKKDLLREKRNLFMVQLFYAVSAVFSVLVFAFVFGGWWHGN